MNCHAMHIFHTLREAASPHSCVLIVVHVLMHISKKMRSQQVSCPVHFILVQVCESLQHATSPRQTCIRPVLARFIEQGACTKSIYQFTRDNQLNYKIQLWMLRFLIRWLTMDRSVLRGLRTLLEILSQIDMTVIETRESNYF